MKLKIEIVEGVNEEVVIRCNKRDEKIERLKSAIENLINADAEAVLFIGETEFYVPYKKILFFEASDGKIIAHTKDKMFTAKTTLSKLEEILPPYFIRASKSCIINARQVSGLAKNLTGPSKVYFNGTEKFIFASRAYFKFLKDKIYTVHGL